MCECQTKIEAQLLEKIKDQFPDGKGHVATLANYALVMPRDGRPSRWAGYMPVDAAVIKPMRKAAGVFRTKATKIKHNMFFSYCPFCGVKYEP